MKSLVIFMSAETELWQPLLFEIEQEGVDAPEIDEQMSNSEKFQVVLRATGCVKFLVGTCTAWKIKQNQIAKEVKYTQ